MDARPAVRSDGGEEAQPDTELVQEGASSFGQVRPAGRKLAPADRPHTGKARTPGKRPTAATVDPHGGADRDRRGGGAGNRDHPSR